MAKKTLLHVGCGTATIKDTQFDPKLYKEIRLDINEDLKPDIIGSILDMKNVKDGSVDVVYSCHNLEHVQLYDVPIALKEFKRVLKKDGFLVVRVPDLQQVAHVIAEGDPLKIIYNSPAGPIMAHDCVYGHAETTKNGNVFMYHKSGFTAKMMHGVLLGAGFEYVAVFRKKEIFDIGAVAFMSPQEDSKELQQFCYEQVYGKS